MGIGRAFYRREGRYSVNDIRMVKIPTFNLKAFLSVPLGLMKTCSRNKRRRGGAGKGGGRGAGLGARAHIICLLNHF